MTVIRSRAGRILAAATLAAAGSLAYAGTAEAAVTCYGDYCSGQDPHATHCEDDAFSVASAPVSGTPYVLNLRWSPTCKTNWAQLAGDPNPRWIKAEKSTRYKQQYTLNK
jgi:hypothetical protein